jgi:hypothetical protein
MFGQKLVIGVVCSLALIGLTAIGSSLFSQLGCEGQMVNISFSPPPDQEIWGERFVAQSFLAPRDDLNSIDLLLQTYRRRNTGEVTFRLLEMPPDLDDPFQGIELYSTTFEALEVSDQSWYRFRFPAISDSAGKTYLLILQSPNSEPGNAITVGGIDHDKYPLGSAFAGPVPIVGDITFRACFQMSVVEKMEFLANQLTRHRPGLWGNPAFYVIILGGYAFLLTGFFWSLIRFGSDR